MIRFMKRRTVVKTTSYTVSPNKGDFSGSVFTTRGALGAVVFTLPNPTMALAECLYTFIGIADQNLTVAAPAGKVVAFNNAAATSLAATTAGQKIGAVIQAQCDGVSWILQGDTLGVAYTVA